MFRILSNPNVLPASFALHTSAEFQQGQIAQFTSLGNNIVIGVSNGMAPFGIIDDIRTRSFSNNIHDEEHILAVPNPIKNNTTGQLVSAVDILEPLDQANLITHSFTARQISLTQVIGGISLSVNERNGLATVPAGTPLNFDMNGDGIPDSIRFLCSYAFWEPNYRGEDTTRGSNRVTVWYQRMIVETNMYETNRYYPLNAPLYCSAFGLFTTEPVAIGYPAVGFVISPPNRFGLLQLVWH
jgi:hypothetical protein